MNYLQLAQKLRQECEIPGNTLPTAVANQSGQLKRIVDWIADAWNDIQNRHPDWRWMRRPFTLNTVAGTDNYASSVVTDVDAGAVISRFSRWWADDSADPPLAYLQSGGVGQQYRLHWLPWESFKWLYRVGTQNNATPIHVSVDYQNKLCVGPKPDAIYVVTGDFQRNLQRMTADADIPEMPAQLHELIVYWAMTKYGANSVASEIYTRAQAEVTRLMDALELNQRPAMCLGGSLV